MPITDILVAFFIRLFSAMFIWAIFFTFPLYLKEQIEEFPEKRTDLLRLLANFTIWIVQRIRKQTETEDDLALYVLQTLSLLMMFIGIIVNLIGDFINDNFVESLGIEIIAAFIITRTIGVLLDLTPTVNFMESLVTTEVIPEALNDENDHSIDLDSNDANITLDESY